MFDSLIGKEVIIFSSVAPYGKVWTTPIGEKYYLKPIKALPYYADAKIICPEAPLTFKCDQDTIDIPVTFITGRPEVMPDNPSYMLHLTSDAKNNDVHWALKDCPVDRELSSGLDTVKMTIRNKVPPSTGEFNIRFDLFTEGLGFWNCGCSAQVNIIEED